MGGCNRGITKDASGLESLEVKGRIRFLKFCSLSLKALFSACFGDVMMVWRVCYGVGGGGDS
jgi:hypothetical protein